MARRKHYRKPKKPHSVKGIWATGIAFVSAVFCAIITSQAAMDPGNIPRWMTALAMIGMLENFFGLVLAIMAARETDNSLLFRALGLAGTLIMSVFWLFYYMLGLVMV